jgi:hypothetical protein
MKHIGRHIVLAAHEYSPHGRQSNSIMPTPLAITNVRSVSSMDLHGRNYYDITAKQNIKSYAKAVVAG